MLTMFLPKYQAMLPLLLLVMIAGKSLAASDYILSNPRMLQVRTDPSRAAIIISRTVKTGEVPTTPAAASPTTPASEAGNASRTTTTTETPPQENKMTGLMQIAFAGLRELDNNNTEVGGDLHSFSRFNDANLKFLTTSTLSGKRVRSDLNGMSRTSGSLVCQTSRAALRDAGSEAPNATVTVLLCAVQSTGSLSRDGESMTLTNGLFYMSVEIEDWQWCGCGQQEGQFLELNLTIGVPDGYKISRDNATTTPVKISLGTNDSFVLISSKYGTQSGATTTWKPMPTGYPMMVPLNQKATSASVTARVPRPSDGSGNRLHVVALIVEPGYISSEHVRPGTTSAAPRYIGAPAAIIATGLCFMMAFVFSQG